MCPVSRMLQPHTGRIPINLDTSLMPLAEIHVQTLSELRHCTLRNFRLKGFVLKLQ